jgi:hypothetical protein
MEPKRSSEIDLLTLAIAAAAGAAAAYLTSQVWAGGTLITAALTPVIVALVKEALARPADRIQTLRTEKRTTEHPQLIDPTNPDEPYVTVKPDTGHHWKVALVSGAAAFAIIVGVFTIPELVTGNSIGRGGDSGTTLFGGKARKNKNKNKAPSTPAKDKDKGTPTPTATEEPEETPTPERTATPRPTPSPSAAPSTIPTVLATPTQ